MRPEANTASQPLTVQLFAGLAAAAGQRQISVRPAAATVAGVRAALATALPAIGPLLARSSLAVDGRYAPEEAAVGPDSEIAVIPPVSGG